jgi:hypothetical protein
VIKSWTGHVVVRKPEEKRPLEDLGIDGRKVSEMSCPGDRHFKISSKSV